MDSLFERLKSLGLIKAANLPEKPELIHQNRLEDVITGIEIENSFGRLFLSTCLYPWDYKHGKISFNPIAQISLIAEAGKARGIKDQELSKLLFLDTETTGLSGGTGTIAFLVGLGYFSNEGFTLRQYIIRDPTEEPAMLLELANFVDNFSGVVSFNGKAFDLPLLNTRYIINRLPTPFSKMSHLDLLFLSRKLWKNRLKSRALQDIEHEILEIPRTQEEVPGWMIPQIYFDYLKNGDAEPLQGVVYHNGMDILSLAAIFLHISKSFEHISSMDQFHPVDYFSIGQVYYDLQFFDLAEKIFLACLEGDALPPELLVSTLKYTGDIYKKQDNFVKALPMWQRASELGDFESPIELAKYYEHCTKEYPLAVYWTKLASSNLSKKGYHTYQSSQLNKEIEKRKLRLLQKLEKEVKNVPTKNP